jgi:hypothetical protein
MYKIGKRYNKEEKNRGIFSVFRNLPTTEFCPVRIPWVFSENAHALRV